MILVIFRTAKRGAALFTLADLLPDVHAKVSPQTIILSECLPTDVTHMRLESAVCQEMSRQTSSHSKRLATLVAAEWPLSCVCSPMACHNSQ